MTLSPDSMAEFSCPAVKVHSRAIVGRVEGVATISDNGYAVGFDEMSVKGTSGGADAVLYGPGVKLLDARSWRRIFAPTTSSGSREANRRQRNILREEKTVVNKGLTALKRVKLDLEGRLNLRIGPPPANGMG